MIRKVYVFIMVLFLPLCILATDRIISYQGYARDAAGIPVNGNSINVTIKFYNTTTGGSPLASFSETHTVSINNGIFTIQIGSKTTGGIPIAVFAEPDSLYLSVSIAGQEQLPRPKIVYIPYALETVAAKTNCLDYPGTIDAGTFCISYDYEPVMYNYLYEMQLHCESKGMRLCDWTEYSHACAMWQSGIIQMEHMLNGAAYSGQPTRDRSGTTNRAFGNGDDKDLTKPPDCYNDYGGFPINYYSTHPDFHFRCCITKK